MVATKPEEVNYDMLDQFVAAYANDRELKREIERRNLRSKIESLGIMDAVPIGNQDEPPCFRWGFMEFRFGRGTELDCWLHCMSCGESLLYLRVESKADIGYKILEFKKLPQCMKCNQPVYLREPK